jgi:RNA polymerase sigma-70 factor, ECF subfamily
MTDNELSLSASGGNETAFAELLARHRKMVWRIVGRFFQRRDEIEELVHITFIEAWISLGTFHGESPKSFAAWLARITANSCYDELRRRKRIRERTISQLNEGEASFLFKHATGQPSGSQIEDQTISRDLIHKLLLALEPVDRQVFTMLKAEDLTIGEISELTGWSESKVKMRIHRTKSILQRRSRRLI